MNSDHACAARVRLFLLFELVLAATGCAINDPLTRAQRLQLEHPPATIVADVDRLQPGVVKDIRAAEQSGLRRGRPLTAAERSLATKVGVAHADQVRVVVTAEFPEASNAVLATGLKKRFGVGTGTNRALTMGHAIYIQPKYADKRWMLAHELTHVAQFEMLGYDRFVHDYLLQLMLVGYAQAPIESAARANEHLGRE